MDKRLTVNGFEVEPSEMIQAPKFFSSADRIKHLPYLVAEYEDGTETKLVDLDDVLRILNEEQK